MKTKKKKKKVVFLGVYFFLLVSLSELCTDNLLQNKLLRQELLKNQVFLASLPGHLIREPKGSSYSQCT